MNLATALVFAQELGVPVFPCREAPSGKYKAKSPLTQKGFYDATIDVEQINRWWSSRPGALVGAPTGIAGTGFDAIDIDDRDGELPKFGSQTLARPEVSALVSPLRLVVRTPSGGRHLWVPPSGDGVLTDPVDSTLGIDYRGDGGYIIVPGTRLPDGRAWEVDHLDIDILTRLRTGPAYPFIEPYCHLVGLNRRGQSNQSKVKDQPAPDDVEDDLGGELSDQLRVVLEALAARPEWGLHREDTRRGPEWRSACPVHSEKPRADGQPHSTRSLTIARGASRPVVLYCHGSCAFTDILAALDLTLADIMGPAPLEGIDPNDPRPKVDITNEPDGADTLVRVLGSLEVPPLYVRGGHLCDLHADAGDEQGLVPVEEFRSHGLRAWMHENVITFTVGKEGAVRRLVSPPLCATLLARHTWPSVRPLKGVVSTPVLRPDGSVLQNPGYDDDTGLYLSARFDVPEVAERPTKKMLDQAKGGLLDHLLVDFPWVTAADLANFVAGLFSPIVRPLLPGPTPLLILSAPERGSGKTLLAQILATLYGARFRNYVTDDAEMRKAITAVLRDTAPIIVFDNLPDTVAARSAVLAMLLTAPEWADRLLGFSVNVRYPNDRLWVLTGTNVRIGGDLGRRSMWARIDPQQPTPWERTDFKHSDLLGWIYDHRGEVLWALLTCARSWVCAGAPRGEVVNGEYTRWTRAVGGLLEHIGVTGFMENRIEVMPADEDDEAWAVFFAAWEVAVGSKAVTCRELLDMAANSPTLWTSIPTDQRGDCPNARILGLWLKQHEGRYHGQRTIRRVGLQSHHKVAQWALVPYAQ
jgi:Bifunctional DNA primase/polymerase, N-terminal